MEHPAPGADSGDGLEYLPGEQTLVLGLIAEKARGDSFVAVALDLCLPETIDGGNAAMDTQREVAIHVPAKTQPAKCCTKSAHVYPPLEVRESGTQRTLLYRISIATA